MWEKMMTKNPGELDNITAVTSTGEVTVQILEVKEAGYLNMPPPDPILVPPSVDYDPTLEDIMKSYFHGKNR